MQQQIDLQEQQEQGISQEQIKEIKQAFDIFDSDGNGTIDPKEFMEAVNNLGFKEKLPFQINQLIYQLDCDGNGLIDFEEFLKGMTSNVSTKAKELTDQDMLKVFRVLTDDKEQLDEQTIKQLSQETDIPINNEMIKYIVQKIDNSQKGSISFEQFKSFLLANE